jgi:hypothetical protein
VNITPCYAIFCKQVLFFIWGCASFFATCGC